MIYLDNAATTKPCQAAIDAMADAMTNHWGNPSALHRQGMEADRLLQTARKQVATALGATPDRVFFTAGGTEADNWAIYGTVSTRGKRGRHIVTTKIEHHAVLLPMEHLASQGYEVTYLEPDEHGYITPAMLAKVLRKDTILVSIMMVNNEVGSVMDIATMAKLVHQHCPHGVFHTDAVQGFFKVPFSAKTLGADLISISSHKVHGPKGAGALYMAPTLQLHPYIRGGGQERGFRSGTEAMPSIVSFGAAVASQMDTYRAHISHMHDLLGQIRNVLQSQPHVTLLGDGKAPHVLSLAIPPMRSQEILNRLQDLGIYVSAGSACSKGHRSGVLEAMGVAPNLIDCAIRISLDGSTTQEDVDTLLAALIAFGKY